MHYEIHQPFCLARLGPESFSEKHVFVVSGDSFPRSGQEVTREDNKSIA